MFSTRIFKSIIAIILLLTITCSLFACNAAKPSEDSFKKAYEGALDDTMEGIDKYYEKLDKYDPSNATVSANISLGLSDELISALSSAAELDLGWIEGLAIGFMQSWKDEKVMMNVELDYNQKQLISGKAVIDIAKEAVYVAIPELASKFIKVDSSLGGLDFSFLKSTMNLDYSKIIPEQAVVERIINRYYDIVMEHVTDVSFDDETLTVNGVSQKCVEYTAELTQVDVTEIVIDVLEAIQDDEDIKNVFYMVVDYMNELTEDPYYDYDIDAKEEYDAFIEYVEEGISDFEDLIDEGEATNDIAIKWTSYITGKLDVIGTKIKVFADDDEDVVLYFAKAQDKDDIGVEIYVENAGTKVFEIEGELTDDGKVLEGTYGLTANGESMFYLDLKDVDAKKLEEEGYFNGTIALSPSKELVDMIVSEMDVDLSAIGLTASSMALELDIKQENDEEAKLTVSLMNGDSSYASITIDASISGGQDISVPSDEQTTTNPEDWAKYISFGGLLDNLSESGIPEYVVEFIETAIYGEQ